LVDQFEEELRAKKAPDARDLQQIEKFAGGDFRQGGTVVIPAEDWREMRHQGIHGHPHFKNVAAAVKLGRHDLNKVIDNQRKVFFDERVEYSDEDSDDRINVGWKALAKYTLMQESGIFNIKRAIDTIDDFKIYQEKV
jgi:hypothetical protein